MMRFNHTTFFDGYRSAFGKLTTLQVSGIENLLLSLEHDPDVTDLRWAAYMLATVKHECANTWQPIQEYGKGAGKPYGKKVTVIGADGIAHRIAYYGRGYVQLTWRENYEKMSHGLGLGDTLLMRPELALEPDISYRILSHGMRHGSFTGKKLADYIASDVCDYKNARKIINGLDKWALIKGYADTLTACLTQSVS